MICLQGWLSMLRNGYLATCVLGMLLVAGCQSTRRTEEVAAQQQPESAQPAPETLGARVAIESWSKGISITLDGVTVSEGSNMVITRPPWSPHYYLGPDVNAVKLVTIEELEGGGRRYHVTHNGENGSFKGRDTITVTPDNRVERVFEGEFTEDEGEALIQWQIAGLNPTLIVGRKYRAMMADGSVKAGIVPVVPVSRHIEPCTLAKGFRSIEFDSRLGPLRIDVECDHEVICYDYRKNRWAEVDKPKFWLGELGARFSKGHPLRYRIVFHLPPSRNLGTGGRVQGTAPVSGVEDAQAVDVSGPVVVIPRPKKAEYFDGGYVVENPHNGFVCARVIEEEGQPQSGKLMPVGGIAGQELRRFLVDCHGMEFRPAQVERDRLTPEVVNPLVRLQRVPVDSLKPEGYRLHVSSDEIVAEAADDIGFLYAVQTLKQLAVPLADGRVMFRSAEIEDWPSLPFRGVHLFTGGKGTELHDKLFRDVIGALKMNRLVMEAEYVEWDSHPEIHHPEYGMPKDEVRHLLTICGSMGIEVIPLVMSLGHCQWMFETGHNLDLAEDPEAIWAYCVTNPDTYKFIFEIYEEAIELFHPKTFHIGHDEFHHRGRVPYRESSKEYTVEQLFVMDTLRLHEWFSEKGIKLMMWGDMLLGPGEGPDAEHAASKEVAQELRNKIPNDIAIADWHYVVTDPSEYVNLEVFHKDGFKTVASTWDRAGNIIGFAKAAYDNGSQGLLQTTWAGYSLDPERFKKSVDQYAAYVLAAEASWNADNPPNEDTYPTGAHFLRLMKMSSLVPGYASGWTADLTNVCNYDLAAENEDGWFGFGPAFDLSVVPAGAVRMGGLLFNVSGADDGKAVALRGLLSAESDLPGEVEISLNAKASRLALLHTMNFPCRKGEKVGSYRVVYQDGSGADVELVYGRNIVAYNDLTALAEAPMVWNGANEAGQGVSLRAMVWSNPQPAKVIRSITATSGDAAGSLMLLGITGLE